MVTVSDITYTVFALENHGGVWKQELSFIYITSTSNIDKEMFSEHKKLTESQMKDVRINVENRSCHLKVKPKCTSGQNTISFSHAVKAEELSSTIRKETNKNLEYSGRKVKWRMAG